MIIERKQTILSPWVTLVTKSVKTTASATPAVYHSIGQADYISVLALTADGRVPLVRQFRPAIERQTLELPGGLLDPGEAPVVGAERELREETGYVLTNGMKLLGKLVPDTGRMENSLWCYFAGNVIKPDDALQSPEHGVHCEMFTVRELIAAIEDGAFDHALHVAIIGLAIVNGLLQLPEN